MISRPDINVKNFSRQLCTGIFASAVAEFCLAGTSAGLFSVSITLNKPGGVTVTPAAQASRSVASGVCISQTLSEQTNALVQIVCATEQFVSIAPVPGKRFLGTHGGAFRYNFQSGASYSGISYGALSAYIGAGTVTALRIYNANGSDGPLEMLVSF